MDEHRVRTMLEGSGGAAGSLLRAALWLPGKAYGELMRLRRRGYAAGRLRSTGVDAPVVSIGNLTAGGSGKTPLTALIANRLADRGLKPAILLRGYRASAAGRSDEAVLYGELCPRARVEVGRDRVAGARRAIEAGCDILLMDDGFQHLKLRRDCDIVLIDATAPWGGGNAIPGGLLREPPAALAAADIVVVTRSDQASSQTLAGIHSRIASLAPGVRVFTARHAPARLRPLGSSALLPLDSLHSRPVVALSGIARPEAFVNTLTHAGAVVKRLFAGSDHRDFDPSLVRDALKCAREYAAVVVTTEKDSAKDLFTLMTDNALVDINNVGREVWVLGVDQEVDQADELFALINSSCILRECGHNLP